LQSPNVVLTQAVELPDGTRYATIARTTDRSVYSRKTQDRRMIVALGCELQFANDITYFDESGHRFDQDPAPIGLNCQTCERHHCAQRAHHPLHVTLNFETHRRGATRYEN
jgi:predicted transcriptional regulator